MPEHPPIWPGTEIPVLGVSGEYQSGKTLFVNTIDPERTLLFDFEKSASAYSSLPVTRVDVPNELLAKFPGGYKPIDAFVWFREAITAIKPGQYSVIAVDPISDIESGLCDWVFAHPEHFNRTSAQYIKSGGIFWGDVKNHWKLVLADLAARCQTFAFTTHMRAVWGGSKPTGEREPKGKDTLRELSTLFMVLTRLKDKKTQRLPNEPAGIVLKERLGEVQWDPEAGKVSIRPRLPARLPIATPAMVRAYISKPADLKKPKAGEVVPAPDPLTEDEKLHLQAEIAENQRETEEIRAGRLDEIKRAAETAAARKKAAKKQTPKTDDDKAAEASGKEKTKAARAADSKPEPKGDISEGTGEVIPPAPTKPTEPPTKSPAAAQEAQEATPATDPSSPAGGDPEPATDEATEETAEERNARYQWLTDEQKAGPIEIALVADIIEQMDDIGMSDEQRESACARRGCNTPQEFTMGQGLELRKGLYNLLTKRDMAADAEKSAKKA